MASLVPRTGGLGGGGDPSSTWGAAHDTWHAHPACLARAARTRLIIGRADQRGVGRREWWQREKNQASSFLLFGWRKRRPSAPRGIMHKDSHQETEKRAHRLILILFCACLSGKVKPGVEMRVRVRPDLDVPEYPGILGPWAISNPCGQQTWRECLASDPTEVIHRPMTGSRGETNGWETTRMRAGANSWHVGMQSLHSSLLTSCIPW